MHIYINIYIYIERERESERDMLTLYSPCQAEMLVGRGVRELNLIAEDTNQFGSDWGESDSRRLSDFLAALEKIEGLRWVTNI